MFLLLPILDWWPLHIGHCTEANFKICFEDSALNSTRMGDYNLLPLSMFDLAFNKYHTSVKVYSPHSVNICNMARIKYSSPDVLFKSKVCEKRERASWFIEAGTNKTLLWCWYAKRHKGPLPGHPPINPNFVGFPITSLIDKISPSPFPFMKSVFRHIFWQSQRK